MVPTVDVNMSLNIENKNLKKINFVWTFSDIYTKELTSQYDKNKNNKLDEDELEKILEIKNNYLSNKNMLTEIKLLTPKKGAKTLAPKYKDMKINIKDNILIYTFNSVVDEHISDNSQLSFSFQDNEGYFSFIVSGFSTDTKDIYYTKNLYLFTANILFSYTPFEQTTQKTQTNTTPKDIEEDFFTQENILKKSIERIKSLFESIKDESNPIAYITLLFFAYMYGIIHALGPGHGKTLVASYFLTNERSYTKALVVSIAIGVVHTFSAFLLTVVIYFFLDVLFAQFVDDTVNVTTKLSALIIIFIALYLLIKKHYAYKELKRAQYNFSSSPHPQTCACASCKVDKDSTDAALIISAGIIPCPGTITIFIFTLSLGLYTAGFLSALTMSFGMSTIIFFSAVLSVFFRKKTTNTSAGFKKFLEYTSLLIILGLGIILLFG
jgi:ABC-type nickel/cobalt efflux system permease component RcnA